MAAAASPAKGATDAKAELMKFPRTPHIIDLGGTAVTRDDLLWTEK